MNKWKVFALQAATLTLLNLSLQAQKKSSLPSKFQLAWHDQEFYLFAHFGPNTFTDKEWGHGDEPEDVFNPTQLDCRQWANVARQAGATGIIITAKHHDGFCLWPSKYSTHTVRESKWKDGKGDVLKELSEACKEYGLKFGVYISPWDRNHPDYGTEKYNDVFVNMMKELFAGYGPIWELWWDGANGEGPNGKKQVYDWKRFEKTVKQLSPSTVVFSDVGPHIRWVGNEEGFAGTTNWNYLNTDGFTRGIGAPPVDTLTQGNRNGKKWLPAECDVSIRPGWFYHANEDTKVKTPAQLFQLYLKSVGRGANLLLNVPPDRRGLIHSNDSAALVQFQKLKEENFKTDIAKKALAVSFTINDPKEAEEITDQLLSQGSHHFKAQLHKLTFSEPQKINCFVLKEDLRKGQFIEQFVIQINSGNKREILKGTTVGHKRIITFPTKEADKISFYFISNRKEISSTQVEAYLIDEKLVE
ncbi:MAG: alpha-L-fucosidase [Chitinophagaceae bacterium]